MTQLAEQSFGLPCHAVENLQTVFARRPAIHRVLIYGSRAKGNYRKASDIDLCIEGASLTVSDLLAIETEIDDLLLPWRVDLARRQHIEDPELIEHINRVGRVFFQRQPHQDDAS